MARQRDDEQAPSRRMNISSRLVLLLVIPLTGLLAVTGFGVYSGATQAREASGLGERTDLALSSFRLVDALQDERASLVAERTTTPEMQDAVQVASEDLTRRAGELGGELEADAATALRSVQASQQVAERGLGGAVALRIYSTAVRQLLDLSTVAIDPAGAIDGAAASTAQYLARAQAASAEERDLVQLLIDTDALDAASFQEVMSLASAQRSYAELAAATAPPALALQIREVFFAMSAADTVRRDAFVQAADSDTWLSGLTERTEELDRLEADAEAGAVAAVDDLARSSRLLLVVASLAAVASLLISILLLRRATRSIARPLQDLAVQAEDVARTRLPEAVAAQQSRDGEEVHLPALRATGASEVHDVATAFNDVQDTALRLAGEQAALRVNQSEALTNLGRRNQTLLARQLDFISSLEKRETDPAFLDHLFKLDHLASRMRRNAESLLILAGSETPRRRRRPAPISEIVRAAMSEVEEFERVRIGNVRDATIAGPAVIDLVHLLAELIENALGFSPPDTTVEIDGRPLGQGGYQFAVIDHGVGMTDVELVAANQRLRGLDELEGMPTRYLGQYVVAKLASKTGAMVRLQPSSGGRGVTALVILPSAALVGEPDRDSVARPLPGSRASREQGPVPYAPGTGVVPVTEMQVPQSPVAEPAPEVVAFERQVPSAGDPYDAPSVEAFEPVDLAEVSESTGPVELAESVGTAESVEADPFDLGADLWFGASTVDGEAADGEAADGEADGEAADEAASGITFGNRRAEADPFAVHPAASSIEPETAADEPAADLSDVEDPAPGIAAPESPALEHPALEHPALEHPALEHPGLEDPAPESAADALAESLFGTAPEAVEPEAADSGAAPATPGVGLFGAPPMGDAAATAADVAGGPLPDLFAEPVDPWQQFMGEDNTGEERRGEDTTDVPVVPPPTPPVAPVQPGWVPAGAASDGHLAGDPPTDHESTDHESTDHEPGDERSADDGTPFAVPSPAAVPTSASAAMPTPPLDRSGGLTRRVPGRSLAESRGDQIGAGAEPASDRSADGVRSMLSSFQAGRHRGRAEPDAVTGDVPIPGGDTPVSTDHDSVHDGRFPQ